MPRLLLASEKLLIEEPGIKRRIPHKQRSHFIPRQSWHGTHCMTTAAQRRQWWKWPRRRGSAAEPWLATDWASRRKCILIGQPRLLPLPLAARLPRPTGRPVSYRKYLHFCSFSSLTGILYRTDTFITRGLYFSTSCLRIPLGLHYVQPEK